MKKNFIFLIIILAVTLQAAPVYWNGNSHYYEVVLQTTNWATANSAAINAGGYLATITSAEENAFIYSLLNDNNLWFFDDYNNGLGPWLGGYRINSSPSGWAWVTGENFNYTNWAPGEPNNWGGVEDRLHFFGHQTLKSAQWNDLPQNFNVHGYIIEYNVMPEMNTLVLFGAALLLLKAFHKK